MADYSYMFVQPQECGYMRDSDLHTGASDPVTDTVAAVGDVMFNPGGELLTLDIAYTKGTETGMYLYVSFFETEAAAVAFRAPRPMDIGGGTLVAFDEEIRIDASTNYSIPINVKGKKFYQVFQVKVGGTVSGTFTLHQTLKR